MTAPVFSRCSPEQTWLVSKYWLSKDIDFSYLTAFSAAAYGALVFLATGFFAIFFFGLLGTRGGGEGFTPLDLVWAGIAFFILNLL
jgi:hypothetical protein